MIIYKSVNYSTYLGPQTEVIGETERACGPPPRVWTEAQLIEKDLGWESETERDQASRTHLGVHGGSIPDVFVHVLPLLVIVLTGASL